MTPRDFVYWLQGFFELEGAQELTPVQVMMIKEHIALVLKKETSTSSPFRLGPDVQSQWPNGVNVSC